MSDFQEQYARTRPDFQHIAEVLVLPEQKSWQIPPEGFINHTSSVGPILMDGVYDFTLIAFIQQVFAEGANPRCLPVFCGKLLEYLSDQKYEQPERLIASVDHLSPFLTKVAKVGDEHERERLYVALAFLMTINRVPLLHSGNEYRIEYSEPGALFAGGLDQTFHENVKELIRIRRDHAAFRRGSLTPLDSDVTIAYAREAEGEAYIVVLNNAAVSQSTTIELGAKGIVCSRVKSLFVEHDPNIQLVDPGTRETSLAVTVGAWEPKIIQCI
jgi:hypothetical protein